MDPVAHNRRAWDRLARAGSRFTRPEGPLPRTHRAMRGMLDRRGHLRGRRLMGARVLVLAGGGGLHAVLFAKLGAQTTLVDFSRRQVAMVRVLARRARVPAGCIRRLLALTPSVLRHWPSARASLHRPRTDGRAA
jgi:2-polyprenyl-3-methyl-5-hydroxy-6-metoxy-1,4-benzoquinol methylase